MITNMKRSVTIDIQKSGQQRAYGDHIYEGVLTFSVPEGQLWASKVGDNPETVKPYIALMLHHFEPETVAGWWVPRLTKLQRLTDGEDGSIRWLAQVTYPYTD